MNIDLNKIVVFPCVVLTGPNCKVEYILTEWYYNLCYLIFMRWFFRQGFNSMVKYIDQ